MIRENFTHCNHCGQKVGWKALLQKRPKEKQKIVKRKGGAQMNTTIRFRAYQFLANPEEAEAVKAVLKANNMADAAEMVEPCEYVERGTLLAVNPYENRKMLLREHDMTEVF